MKLNDRRLMMLLYVEANPGCMVADAVLAGWSNATRENRSMLAYAYHVIGEMIDDGFFIAVENGRGRRLYPKNTVPF